MRIAKPLLLITTPIGLAVGVYEAFRLAGSLTFLMIALLLMIGACMGMLVHTIRKERAQERKNQASQQDQPDNASAAS
jgi:F0F1-type ATP synthase assembly protein I